MPRLPPASALLFLAALASPAAARAQPEDQSPAAQAIGGNSAPGGIGVPGGSSGFGHHRGNSQDTGSAPGEMPELKPLVEPRQRLDPGALLCHTEAQLKQHQAAIMARLQGGTAPEPAGCHIISETIAVAVLHRDGQALTQVQLAGDTPQAGWTDSVVRDSDPLHSPIK